MKNELKMFLVFLVLSSVSSFAYSVEVTTQCIDGHVVAITPTTAFQMQMINDEGYQIFILCGKRLEQDIVKRKAYNDMLQRYIEKLSNNDDRTEIGSR